MKIGKFAKKFNTNISTVRYYIQNGLITPVKMGTQYEFDDECIADMGKIIEYKRYNFTLEEIQLLFFLAKASRFKDEVINEVYKDILQKKRKGLIDEQTRLTHSIEDIEKEIAAFSTIDHEEAAVSGVPFLMMPFLYCPSCNVPLKLDAASLSNGSIQKGDLSCDCGYVATISDGIIFCREFAEETPFKAFENIESIMAMKDQFSPAYRMLISKAYIWMYNQMSGGLKESKYIMAGPFTFNFLLEYIEKLGKHHTYIIFDPSIKRIERFKRYLSSEDYNTVYIVGKAPHLPIKKAMVDIYIDDYSTTNCQFTYSTFSTNSLAPLMKHAGEVVGIFTSYTKGAKSLYNFKKNHPDFMPEKMTLSGLKYHWAAEGINIAGEKIMGSTTPNEVHFPQNVQGESIKVHGYHGKRESIQRL